MSCAAWAGSAVEADHLRPTTVEIETRSADETRYIGRLLGEAARAGDVFLLIGDLGAGKTTLTQGVLWGLGGEEYARSPTFVLVSEYEARLVLHHVDLYRLEAADQVHDLGIEEYLYGDGLCVVEWADRAVDHFPDDHLRIQMERSGGTTHRLALSSSASKYERHLSTVRDGLRNA